MKCPVCRERSMYVVEHADIELDVCATCEGVWFDGAELDLLLGGETPLALAEIAPAGENARPCPRCRKKMAKMNIGSAGGVTIDVCTEGRCGLWFDRGELRVLCSDLTATGWVQDPAVLRFLSEVFPEAPAGA